jgi:hypothetical protein
MVFAQLLEEACDPETGEIGPQEAAILEEFFAEIEEKRDAKVNGYVAVMKNWELEAACRIAAAERLEAEAKAIRRLAGFRENRMKRLKARLMEYMQAHDLKRINTTLHEVRVQANSTAPLEVSCRPEELPAWAQHVEITPATASIRAALARGEEVPGCKLLPRQSHLRIY